MVLISPEEINSPNYNKEGTLSGFQDKMLEVFFHEPWAHGNDDGLNAKYEHLQLSNYDNGRYGTGSKNFPLGTFKREVESLIKNPSTIEQKTLIQENKIKLK